MKAITISLNFNPGHFSHLMASYKLLEDCGYESYLYINPRFNQFDENNEFRKINTPAQLAQLSEIKIAVFWFPSIRNIWEAIRFKFFLKSQIVYIYHEPFDSIKNYYNSGFRFKKIVKICLINIVNMPVLLLADNIILPSNAAFSLYQKKYLWINKNASRIPLLFDDETTGNITTVAKQYISYIGTVAADHAFDKFVTFVDIAITNNWFDDMVFLIATGSQIPEQQKAIIDKHQASGRLRISAGHFMTNAEINEHYRNSIVVWNAYNRSMQSGVLPKAYMFGTPVIVLAKNANEYILDDHTGILIDDNNNIQQIKDAIQKITSNKEIFVHNCRELFLNVFFYKSKIADVKSVIR